MAQYLNILKLTNSITNIIMDDKIKPHCHVETDLGLFEIFKMDFTYKFI